MDKKILLEMREISKRFPGVLANNQVSFEVRQGEIHALLGENGAGKTTLMNVLYGLYPADGGEIYWKGNHLKIQSPRDAIEAGINMIHQHFMLIPKFTVNENIIMGTEEGRRPHINLKASAERIKALSKRYNLYVDPWVKISDLSVGEQQRVEIIKALYRGAELLIMDEPTSVLTPGEVEHLFDVLNQLREEKRSIIFISHKLNEVLKITDRISVLRDGHLVGTVSNTPELQRTDLAQMMVGRPVSLTISKQASKKGEVVLKLENLKTSAHSPRGTLHGITLEVHRGEVFGIAGVDGNGQSDLVEVIMGLTKQSEGRVMMLGQDITNWSTEKIRQFPIAYIPEERQKVGLVMEFPVMENFVLSSVGNQPFGKWWLINSKTLLDHAKEMIARFRIATPSPKTVTSKLSGGNQQKVVLAREVGKSVDLIIASQPTRGLDVDAMRFVFEIILSARENGAGVLYFSTELEEIIGLSDTIGILYEGKLNGVFPAEHIDVQTIGILMAGEKVEDIQQEYQGDIAQESKSLPIL